MTKPSKKGGERARASVSPYAGRHHVAGYFPPTPEGPGPHFPYLGSPPAACKSPRPAPPYIDEGANPMSVEIAKDGPVTIVTIERPAKRNAVDPATADALRDAFAAFAAHDDAKVAILTGRDEIGKDHV